MKRFYFSLICFLAVASPVAADNIRLIYTGIPGARPITNPGDIIANFYQFALMFGGLLAFGAVVYGGIKYTVAAGNPERQHDAKDQITQALVGLLLLMGAYTVLWLVNPKLTNLFVDVSGLQNNTATQPTPTQNQPATLPPMQIPNTHSVTNNPASPLGQSLTAPLAPTAFSSPATPTTTLLSNPGGLPALNLAPQP